MINSTVKQYMWDNLRCANTSGVAWQRRPTNQRFS